MKKIFFGLFLAIFLLESSYSDVHVSGYYKKDGTYVAPYVRSNPNGLKSDNYGYKPSQGVYNKTYGTRDTEWDTPTTITDPDYFIGKSEYESGVTSIHETNSNYHSNSITHNETDKSNISSVLNNSFDSLSLTPADYEDEDIVRAKYWATQGYNFNPKNMTAYSMDNKVEDIVRAKYWATKGYNFNPKNMTAYSMDNKVEDIVRAKYWATKGYNFNPKNMTAYSMDNKVEQDRLKN